MDTGQVIFSVMLVERHSQSGQKLHSHDHATQR